MSNAAIFMHPNAFDTKGPRLLGRHSAGESFLRGFLSHADVERFYFWNAGATPIAQMQALLRDIAPATRPETWIPTTNRRAIGAPGVLSLPGPDLAGEAWGRRLHGGDAYSVCGLTHTTATSRVMRYMADYLIAPVEGHDALICTSGAVRASVETLLDGVRDYLAAEYGGPRRRAEPQRVVIPLGINTADFTTTPEQRTAWRERLEIPEDAAVALYVGRFNIREKMNPALMALALEKAAQATGKPIYWVNSGWAESAEENARYHEGARALCPSVHYREVDGRPPDVRFSIWSVADFFISFSDNIQETFGLTPVEAMAAGLPCIVTDWDGYRDTVRDGLDGFRIPTLAPAPGDGLDLAYWYASGWLTYTDYVGAVGQFTAIDFARSTEAIASLVTNADLRRRLGRQAQARAREVFDWAAIIPQYQALWSELNARRTAAIRQEPVRENPFSPDPFRLFGGYPTRHFGSDWRVAAAPDLALEDARALLAAPIADYSRFARPTLEECAQVLAWLAGRPEAAVGDLVQIFPAARRPAVTRGLLWIARYGLIVLNPPA